MFISPEMCIILFTTSLMRDMALSAVKAVNRKNNFQEALDIWTFNTVEIGEFLANESCFV